MGASLRFRMGWGHHACSPFTARPIAIFGVCQLPSPRKRMPKMRLRSGGPAGHWPSISSMCFAGRGTALATTCVAIIKRRAEKSPRNVCFRCVRKRPPNHTRATPKLRPHRGRAHQGAQRAPTLIRTCDLDMLFSRRAERQGTLTLQHASCTPLINGRGKRPSSAQ